MAVGEIDPRRLAELLEDCARGNHGAFNALYRATWRLVFNVVRRQLIDVSQSEEVAQEVFLEVWQTAARYEARLGSATTWLATLARRRAIDRVRSSQASRERETRMWQRSRETPHDNVLETVETRFDRDRLVVAIAELTVLQREAIAITYLEGHTMLQATAIVGASESALKTRVRDGILSLRLALQSERPAA